MPTIIEDVDSKGWRKLVKINDWGVNGYFWKVVKSDAGTWGINEQDQSQRILPSQRVQVLWPDGTQSIEILYADYQNITVGDHGHNYTVNTYTFYIEQVVRGMKSRVEIDKLRFKPV